MQLISTLTSMAIAVSQQLPFLGPFLHPSTTSSHLAPSAIGPFKAFHLVANVTSGQPLWNNSYLASAVSSVFTLSQPFEATPGYVGDGTFYLNATTLHDVSGNPWCLETSDQHPEDPTDAAGIYGYMVETYCEGNVEEGFKIDDNGWVIYDGEKDFETFTVCGRRVSAQLGDTMIVNQLGWRDGKTNAIGGSCADVTLRVVASE